MGGSTVRMVLKNSGQIEQAVKTYGGQAFNSRCHCMNTVIIHMERYLAHFLHGKEKEVAVNGQCIKE